ncbi:TonB-dependent receptor [Kordiimonas pumila]|uniref:TonB-dependent receptor n=1 Tax=Kordiimonas pumila TaxID=2161677 RepID=A0ABV7D607_9PROT|nr:TonB-dependent receptor [Kordiimonas pumila]
MVKRSHRNILAFTTGLSLITAMTPGVFAAATPEQRKEFVLEEILVTAQKRTQNINDVGIAITAFDGKTLKELRFTQPSDIASQTPNFSVANLATNIPNFTIRGVGVNDYAINQGTSVGSYADQVYIASPAMMLFQMFDTERVEVLKGPQGTLYGRNTTGGAVLFNSKMPTEEFEASLDTEYGNYGRYVLEGAVSGPISDTLLARVAFNVTKSDGYQENLVTGNTHGGIDRQSWRVLLKWLPSADIDFLLNAHGGVDNSSLNSVNVPGVGGNTASGGTIDTANGVPYRDNDSYGVSLIANWDMGQVMLTSVSGFEKLDRFEYGDTDGLEGDGLIDQILISDIEQFTQELRLASNGSGPTNWVAGLYYGRDKIIDSTDYPVTGAGFPPAAFGLPSSYATLDVLGNRYTQISTSKAIFGQIEWDFSDQWKLTAGLRYSAEDKEFNDVTTPWIAEPGPGESGPIDSGLMFPAADYSADYSAVSGKIALDYNINDDAMVYASISKGFKSGGFQGTLVFSPANIIPFDEETVISYEAGSKVTLLEGRLQVNSALFFYDYQNLQAQGTLAGAAGGVTALFALQNIGDAEVKGFEIDVQALPVEGLNLALGVGYLDSKITDPFIAEVQKGGRPALSPKWNINGRARYEFDLNNDMYMFVQGDFNWQDNLFLDIYETPALQEDDYLLINAAIGIASEDGLWAVSLWGKNLSNTEYRVSAFTGGVAGTVYGYGAPKTYGISASFNF